MAKRRLQDMKGRGEPIAMAIARYYAKRTGLEYDDLYQEAWLGILRYRRCLRAVAAWSGVRDYVEKQRNWQKHLMLIPKPEQIHDRCDARLDAPVYVAKCGDNIDKKIVRLRFWQDMYITDIAARVKLDQSSVHRRLQRAINRMRTI